jgi:rod shape-determining protein MreC
MQRLIDILLIFKEYFVLALLIIISTILLSLNDNAQMRAVRSYTVGFIGFAQDMLATVPNVFELRRENAVLRQLNVNLSDEVSRLREARLENLRLRGLLAFKEESPFRLVAADVVGKSFHLLRNTITLNVGTAESVRVDMPIISESGLVGKVIATSAGYCVGQLMFNKDFRASAKVQRSRVDGIIAWEGGDILRLKNVAKMQDVREGDVITTSEYSNIFPNNIKIGYISKISQGAGTLFKEIEVTPSADLLGLEQVFVIMAAPDSQRVALERILTKVK